MGYLVEKVAYLRGLAEGMKIDDKTNEGKMIGKILEVLEELSANFEDLSDEVLEGEARIDELEECFDELCEELDEGCDCDCCGGDDAIKKSSLTLRVAIVIVVAIAVVKIN